MNPVFIDMIWTWKAKKGLRVKWKILIFNLGDHQSCVWHFICNTASTLTNIPSVTNELNDTRTLKTEHTVSTKIDVVSLMQLCYTNPRHLELIANTFFEKLSFFYSEWKTIEEAFYDFSQWRLSLDYVSSCPQRIPFGNMIIRL